MSSPALPGQTEYDQLVGQIKDWANRQDWSAALTDSFIKQAEQKFNQDLRVDRMISHDNGLIISRCAQLPPDWLIMDLVMIENCFAPGGYWPIKYRARDEFFKLKDHWAYKWYTIEGRNIYFGGTPDQVNGINYKIDYYAEVPVLSPTQNSWIFEKYPGLYLNTCLQYAALHAVGEEQTSSNWAGLSDQMIMKLNAAHQASKASGSRLVRRTRSFG